jgi:hypothetical protein
VRRPVTRVLDGIVFGAAGLYRRTIGRAVAFGREKVEAGREWAKGKVDAAQAWARSKAEAGRLRLTPRELPREPPAEAEQPQPTAGPEPDWPVRLAEDGIEVAPGERHTVFAQLSADGEVDIGISSETRPIGAMLDLYEPRIDTLPEEPPVPLPRGGDIRDRPRSHARRSAAMLRQDPEAIAADIERHAAPSVQVRRRGVVQGAAAPAPRPPPTATPSPARRIVTLADMIEGFLRIFRVYDRPELEAVPDEPAGGQQLEARVWTRPDDEGRILPTGGRLGVDPTRPRGPDYAFIAEPPGLVGPERSRGIVGQEAQDPAQPNALVRTWAVGGTHSTATNTSHTENLFAHWFTKQTEAFWERVTAIELHSVLSPCSACTDVLKGVAKQVRPRTPLIVLWDRVYWGGGKSRAAKTTRHDVGVLRSNGWFYEGPMPPA